MLRTFLIALQFLTRIPVPLHGEPAPQDLGRSVLFYPLVGAVIGITLAVLHMFLAATDAGVQAALILIVWVTLTGALHLDGLADTADAWIGGQGDRERTLAIMKDAYSGAAAITAVVLLLLLKYASLKVLLVTDAAWAGLLAVPAVGRLTVVGLFLTTPYVRPGGIGARQAEHLPRRRAWAALTATVLIVIGLCGWGAIGLILTALILSALLRHWMRRRLGGMTGDTAGALIEVAEAGGLVALALIVA